MADDTTELEPAARRDAPRVVAPSTRVNVALPFGTIQVREPSKELTELTAIVGELVAAVEPLVGAGTLDDLRARTEALGLQLR